MLPKKLLAALRMAICICVSVTPKASGSPASPGPYVSLAVRSRIFSHEYEPTERMALTRKTPLSTVLCV